MHSPQLSQSLKHIEALRAIAESDDEHALHIVLEDDVLVATKDLSSALLDLNKALQKQPDWSLCFLCNIVKSSPSTPLLVPVEPNELTFVSAYAVSKTAAQSLLDVFFPIRQIYNLHLRACCTPSDLQCFRVSRSIFINGSKFGGFASSVDPSNALVFNPFYIQLKNLIINNKIELIDKCINDASPSLDKNQDFLALVFDAYILTKRYQQAKLVIDKAYHLAGANGAFLTNESPILKKAITVYKYLQTDLPHDAKL
jgi:hypothetical protein